LLFAALRPWAHRLEPPDVTEGLCEVLLGEDDEPPLVPVFPVETLPLLPVLPVLLVLPDEPAVDPPVE
jgi:hypothetical protein